jgi:Enoyl-(Acyl carrier protein) reductase
MPIVLSTVGAKYRINGPTHSSILSELPGVEPIDRTSMNAFDDRAFSDAVKRTGLKRLIFGGLHIAHEGALVVGCDVNVAAAEATAEVVRAQGGAMISLQPCYLTKPAECQALVDFAARTFGRIDVLFNNAAMAYFNWLEDITDEVDVHNRAEGFNVTLRLSKAIPSLPAS